MRSDLANQEVAQFLGVNLRKQRANLADQEVAAAINADFNSFVGSMFVRNGMARQFSWPLSNLTLRRIAKINGYRYQVAGGVIYRNQVPLVPEGLSGISGGGGWISLTPIFTGTQTASLTPTITGFRPYADSHIWAFFADSTAMWKDNGSHFYPWGITAPTTAPTLGSSGTGLTGTFLFRYTYARMDGAAIAAESNPSPTASITVTNKQIDVSALSYSNDPQVTHFRVYRSVDGGTSCLFDFAVPITKTSGSTTTADNALGVEVEIDHDPPPHCPRVAQFQETIFLCGDKANPNYLWYSNRFYPEYFSNYVQCGTTDYLLNAIVPIAGALAAFKRNTKYKVTGNSIDGYVPLESLSKRGTTSPDACVASENGIIFPAKDGIFVTNLFTPDIPIAEDILPLFYNETLNGYAPINWDQAWQFAGIAYKDRYYMSYASGDSTAPDMVMVYSRATKKWYFYSFPITCFNVEEDVDMITCGSTDGFVYIMEQGSSADGSASITMTADTKDYFGGAPNTRKLFMGFKIDALVPAGTLTANFYVDGVLKRTVSITGNRTKTLLRLPEGCMGFLWRITFSYTQSSSTSSSGRTAIYGVSALWLPIGAA